MISKIMCVIGIIIMWFACMIVEAGDFWRGVTIGIVGLALTMPKIVRWIVEDFRE